MRNKEAKKMNTEREFERPHLMMGLFATGHFFSRAALGL